MAILGATFLGSKWQNFLSAIKTGYEKKTGKAGIFRDNDRLWWFWILPISEMGRNLLISDIVWVNWMELWGLWSWLFMAVGRIHWSRIQSEFGRKTCPFQAAKLWRLCDWFLFSWKVTMSVFWMLVDDFKYLYMFSICPLGMMIQRWQTFFQFDISNINNQQTFFQFLPFPLKNSPLLQPEPRSASIVISQSLSVSMQSSWNAWIGTLVCDFCDSCDSTRECPVECCKDW